VMPGAFGPANPADIMYPVRVMLFIGLLCLGYSLSRPVRAEKAGSDLLLPATVSPPDREWSGLPPWQRQASEKATERYAAAQEKKWRRWNEAMYERSD
jgi:hypothetical protein